VLTGVSSEIGYATAGLLVESGFFARRGVVSSISMHNIHRRSTDFRFKLPMPHNSHESLEVYT